MPRTRTPVPHEQEVHRSLAGPALGPSRRGYERHGPHRCAHGLRGGSDVILTFDDGPGPHTQDILDVLGHHGAKGTFFVVGKNLRGNAELLQRMVAEGHEIANHSWNHPRLSRHPIRAHHQLRRTNLLVEEMTGFSPCLFRAPYGLVSPPLVLVARILGMTTVGWDVDPKDWRDQTPGAIAYSILRSTKGGSFVLLHDGGPDRSRTVSALELALATLAERGFRFPTASEALGYYPRADDPAAPPTGR